MTDFRTADALAALDKSFRPKVMLLAARCAARGLMIQPYFGLRMPAQQARLWRQSRSTIQVHAALDDLRAKGAPYLALVLDGVGPQPDGPDVTNALPGQSWHEFGLAVDCWCLDGAGKPIVDGGDPAYETYAVEAEAIGLTAGAHWHHWKDYDHVQLPAAASPTDELGWPEVDARLKALFDDRGEHLRAP